MKRLNNIKLTPFVATTLFFALLLPTLISSSLFIYAEKQKQLDELTRFQNAVTTVLAASLAAPLWELRHDSALIAIEPILNDERVAFIRVIDYQTDDFFINEEKDFVQGKITQTSSDIFNNNSAIGKIEIGISDIFMQQNLQSAIINVVMIFIFQLLISALILTFAIYKKIIAPINKLTSQAKKLSSNQFDEPFDWIREDEMGKLGKSFEYARNSLQETFKKLELQAKKVENINEKLHEEVAKQVDEITKKDKMMQEQAKLAAMGEMIGAIAHQWRQPLNALSINIQNLDDDYADGIVNEEFITEFIKKQTQTIEFMSKTIDDFRNFFQTDKEMQNFSVQEVAQSVDKLLHAQFKHNNIKLSINDQDFIVRGYKGEMQQVLLNIIANSKDAIIENTIAQGSITIKIDATEKKIFIYDNGRGMDESILDKIFEPYFTTKEQGKGTGIGLHISRIIILDHMKGSIKAYNHNDGLCTEIELKESFCEDK